MLIQRFKETRRKHPLYDAHGGILGSLRAERALLEGIKEGADKVIDTSELTAHDLRNQLVADFSGAPDKNQGLAITVTSFGFKFGLPLDADLVFDVRFLVNPHYVDELRPLDGRNQLVEEYVMRDPDSGLFLDKLYDLMAFSIPRYIAEGKAYLTVAIGCTGGRHRSVMVSEKLGHFLRAQGYRALVQHRDVRQMNDPPHSYGHGATDAPSFRLSQCIGGGGLCGNMKRLLSALKWLYPGMRVKRWMLLTLIGRRPVHRRRRPRHQLAAY